MAATNPTIITSHLDDKDLRDSIERLVEYVGNKTNTMADSFTQGIDKMKLAMKDFAITQKVSVDVMKDAWKNMSQSFDAMVAAQSASTQGGNNRRNTQYPDNTVGHLEEEIRLEQKRRKEMQLGSDVLRDQNRLIEERKNKLKSETTSKKTLKDVLGMDENSVEAVAKKMRELKRVQIDPKNAQQVKLLGDEYQRLSRLQAELLGRNLQATHSNNMLAQSFGYIRNRVVYALTLGALANFTKQLVEIRGQYELLERSLGVLVNSFERGSQIFSQLNQMAIESPFTLMELAGAAKQLTAYNFSAKEVVDTTRRLADISAALGVPMERLTYNLGQIRAQTVLTARDARDFANAGLPIVSALAERFTELEGRVVTTGDVYDRMSKKMVSYSDVMAVLNSMTDEGGKFFEFQAKQAETLRVQMANLTLAWNNMLNEIGERNQGLLSFFVGLIKSLLQNWQTIDRVLKSMLLAFTITKPIQFFWNLIRGANVAKASITAFGSTFTRVIVGIGKALWALAANPWTWIFVGISALIDFAHHAAKMREELHELNQEIIKNAKEASDSMLDFLSNTGNKQTLELAKQNKLSAEEGEKAWEAVKTQIEQSAMSCNTLIAELLSIEDINERVAKGFDYAERIQKAQAALQDLKEDTIKVTSDGWLWGLVGGKGLVSSLKAFANNSYIQLYKNEDTPEQRQKDLEEKFEEELAVTAESINDFIQAYKITDPLQIKEILERVRAQIKAKNPDIKGELATLFDVSLDEKMADLTNGAVDKNATLWEVFMERLKNNYHHAFEDITNEWIKTGKGLTDAQEKEQEKAINQNLEHFKDAMPQYYDTLKSMVADASKLRIQIGVTFNTQVLTDLQKEVNKRINKNSPIDFGSDALLPTNNDTFVSWVKTRQESIDKLKQENKKYALDNSEWAKKRIKDNETQIKQEQNLLDLFHQAYQEDTKNGGKKDVLGEAFQKEIEVIGNIQKRYKEYKAAGVDAHTAITKATNEYAKTLANTNATLNRYGVKTTKNGNELANMDLRDLRDYYTYLLDMAQKVNNVKGVEALEKAIAGLNVEITKIDYKKITDGLNNELGKLKDEYELGIELDANPELGNIFADMLGINSEELQKLPKDFEGVVSRLQTVIDQKLGAGKFNLFKNLNKAAFDTWLTQNQQGTEQDDAIAKQLNAIREYANKVRLDESKKQIEEWNKLLEKYAEYEYKITQIQKQAQREREAAIKKGAPQDVINAINNWEKQQIAGVAFEEFQKSPEWILATGNLANMSRQSIGMLIEELENYKKSAKNLSPKQIKELNNALTKLYKEQRKNSPFHAISDMIDEAKDRMGVFDEEINKTKEEIDKLTKKKNKNLAENIIDDETDKALDKAINKLKELQKKKEEAGKVDATDWVSAINETISAVQSAVGVFNDLSKAIGGVNENDVDKVFSVLSSAGQGAAIGAQVGGGWGALIGGLAGAATSIISLVSSANNEKITDKVEESERAVKRLELAYIDLEHAINEAYGTSAFGAQRLAVANKELQLAELNRQLELEKSRKRKDRDEDKIIDLQKQIRELEYDIIDSVNSITNDLLGISSVGDAMENLMDGFIEALRSGENAMNVFDESIDDMIANMVKKMFTTKILQPWFEEQWNTIQKDIDSRGTDIAAQIKELQKRRLDLEEASDSWVFVVGRERFTQQIEEIDKQIADLEKQMSTAMMPTNFDIKKFAELLRSGRPILEENLTDIQEFLRELGLMNDTKNNGLSALQQGISGVTENTASAIEAYMNIVSQRVFEQNVYLREIRDHVASFDIDIQLGTLSQMLLQLQQSYTVQLAIQNILNGALNPSGRAFMVELNS